MFRLHLYRCLTCWLVCLGLGSPISRGPFCADTAAERGDCCDSTGGCDSIPVNDCPCCQHRPAETADFSRVTTRQTDLKVVAWEAGSNPIHLCLIAADPRRRTVCEPPWRIDSALSRCKMLSRFLL
ncbi:MAG: hypothetical protein KatS3mg114_0947 [Planctomycetaceae bacterium]|nr:MAG: hypothetical protein KatS3mg114_0947 [Planctomycetaceae bacterium]